MPSRVVDYSEVGKMGSDRPLGQREEAATALILQRGVVGFVWLDDGLVVRRRSGVLTDWVEVGAPHLTALPILIGYEEKLAELRRDSSQSIILPNIGLLSGASSPPKLDIQIYWLPGPREYLLVLRHESTQSALQLELH